MPGTLEENPYGTAGTANQQHRSDSDTSGSSFTRCWRLYGQQRFELPPFQSNDDIAGWTNRQSRVSFIPTSGTTYHIAVDGFGGASGFFC